MRRLIASLIVSSTLIVAAAAQARDIEDGKLIIHVTKDGKYQVGDVIVDKVGMYGAVGSYYQDGKDKGKPLVGVLLKKGEKATPEEKHMIYVTAQSMQIGAFIEIDGNEQPIVEAPPPAPSPQPESGAQPAPAGTQPPPPGTPPPPQPAPSGTPAAPATQPDPAAPPAATSNQH